MTEVKLHQLLSFVVDNRGKTPPSSSSGKHELIEINSISSSGKYPQYSNVKKFVDQKTYDSWFRKGHPQAGDILIPTVGTLDAIAYVNESRGCIAQNLIAIRTDEKTCTSQYLYYLLCNPYFRKKLLGLDIGGVQPSIKVPHLLDLAVCLPPLIEQKAIAAILSALDDKIELNNQINKKLEEMAQAIFKSWFVDFEPFQDGEFVESELGLIPKGWRVGTLSELVNIKYGKDHKKLADGIYPVYGSGGIMRYAEKSLYNKESVLIPRKGTLGNVIYINKPFWSVDTMFFTEMKLQNIAKFIYFHIISRDLVSMNAGSAVPSMTADILNNLILCIPIQSELKRFEDVVSPLFNLKEQNAVESATLASIRDTLLPKLMSGVLRVPVEVE